MIQIVLPRIATDNYLGIGATVVAGKGFSNVWETKERRDRPGLAEAHQELLRVYLPILPGKDTTIGRGRIAAALRVNQKLRIADIPIDALQVSRIALPFAERNARVVDKQLMAPRRERTMWG